MADLKTELRETSVIVGALFYTNALITRKKESLLDISTYVNVLNNALQEDFQYAKNIIELKSFSDTHINIIKNGLKLAKRIVNSLKISKISTVKWLGYVTQKSSPIDIVINDYGFSLKEESYILENMGLYKFLSVFTGKEHKRGTNVFKHFALKEYNTWFNYTWNYVVKERDWQFSRQKDFARITVEEDFVKLIYRKNNSQQICKVPKSIKTIEEYEKHTNSMFREKVVGRFINRELQSNQQYLIYKKECAVVAGKNLVDYVKNNLNYKTLASFLQIYDTSYYYAKSTSKETLLFYVPSINEYLHKIKVKSIEYSVPISQLNIITEIQNESTGKEVILRNECRFSHGQFNGTPEAKMYYDITADLSILYDTID
ncbi:MAG: hypothetical protein ACOX24_01330 [Christensenellales bacterium]|jgi:hypothetical protein